VSYLPEHDDEDDFDQLPSMQPIGASPQRPPSRTPLVVALFLVAVLAGSALFAAGFTLGIQQSLAPGTGGSAQGLFDPFWEAYDKIRADYVGGYDPKQLVEGAIKGMFGALDDPYSSYMTDKEYKASMAQVSGEFEGIGATMGAQDDAEQNCAPLSATCHLMVKSVIPGSPADTSGLLPDDQLTAVDGVPVEGSTVDDTVLRVRGPRGTTVALSLLRAGKPLELSVTRDVIQSSSVSEQLLADGTVGYLRIDGFSASAAQDFQAGLQAQLDQGVRKFALDLRDDPGGFVDAALSIASQFVASGPIYWEEHADGVKVPVMAEPDGIATDPGIELVVLVNSGSASASEILAGALQDTGRGALVGETTYGKGTIQQWHQLSGDSGGFRLSIAKWLTPNQTWIHGTGITPNVVVPFPDDTPQGQDPQLDKALQILAAGPTGSTAPAASSLASPTVSPVVAPTEAPASPIVPGPSIAPSPVSMRGPLFATIGLIPGIRAHA
jgi:carboxyl-terminal processing protease